MMPVGIFIFTSTCTCTRNSTLTTTDTATTTRFRAGNSRTPAHFASPSRSRQAVDANAHAGGGRAGLAPVRLLRPGEGGSR
jgi:hypothetical protein